MANLVLYLGLILMVIGYLWGLSLAFAKSTGTGILSLIMGPIWVLVFLLLSRPEGFERALKFIGVGLILAILSNLI